MAVGQGALAESILDVAELNRIGARLEGRETDRAVLHAEQLSDALALHRVYDAAGMGLSSPVNVAMVLNCSENRATSLLMDAEVLDQVGALSDMTTGALTV